MPSGEEVQQYLSGVWQVMIGRREGLKQLDFSADGFWNSFFAIIIAFPPLLAGWVGVANEIAGGMPLAIRLWLLVRLFLADMAVWILPLVVMAFAARPARVMDRFVPYVVASNWTTAFVTWLVMPTVVLRLFVPEAEEVNALISLFLLLLSLFFSWRVTVAVIARGAPFGTAVFFFMFTISIVVKLASNFLLRLEAIV